MYMSVFTSSKCSAYFSPIILFTFKLNMSIAGKFSFSITDTHSRYHLSLDICIIYWSFRHAVVKANSTDLIGWLFYLLPIT